MLEGDAVPGKTVSREGIFRGNATQRPPREHQLLGVIRRDDVAGLIWHEADDGCGTRAGNTKGLRQQALVFGGYALDRTGDPGIMSAVL